jgi:hypothetical protein
MRILIWIGILFVLSIAPSLTYGASLESEAITALEELVMASDAQLEYQIILELSSERR